MKGEEWGFGGLSPEKFLSHAPLRSKERLFWKPISHVRPMLEVKSSQCKFKRNRQHEIFGEKLKKETNFQFMAVLIMNLPKLWSLLSLATGALAQLTNDEDISYL